MEPTQAKARAEQHRHHGDVTGGWLRPAVFGVMDGLVSNFALIAGVVGAGAPTSVVVLTGVAGLAAGAGSMATGEYVSVASQSEHTRAEIAKEKAELAHNPKGERRELTELYIARGLTPDVAAVVAEQLSARPEELWRVHVREELGVDPDDLPSPWVAAGSSFLAFALGAAVPVLPFVFGVGTLAVSIIVTALALFVAGAMVAQLTTVPRWYGGLRQLVAGALAAAVTFGIGSLVGTGL